MEFFDPKKVNYPFVSTFKFFVPLSFTLFFVCLFLMFVKPGFKYGVDFRGGLEANIHFKDPSMNTGKLRSELEGKIQGLTIVEAQGASKNGFTKEFMVT